MLPPLHSSFYVKMEVSLSLKHYVQLTVFEILDDGQSSNSEKCEIGCLVYLMYNSSSKYHCEVLYRHLAALSKDKPLYYK